MGIKPATRLTCGYLQVHTQRKVFKKNELKYWENVPIEAMSSEEESEDGTIYRHKPSWRSDGNYTQ